MNAPLAATWPLLATPWRWRLNQTPLRLLWGGGLGLFGLLGLLAWVKGWPATVFAGAMAAAVLFIIAWMLTLSGLRRQNHPHLARLVPGHVRQLRRAVLLLWGLPTLLAGGAAAALQGEVWVTLLATALGLSLLTALIRWPASFVLLCFVPPVLVPLLQGSAVMQAAVQAWLGVWQAHPAWLCLPLLAGLAWFQMDLMGRGDAAHAQRYEQMQRLLASLQDGAGGFNPRHQGRWGLRMTWVFSWLNRWYLARLVRQARPTQRHALARLELPLYGSAHWTLAVGSMAVVLLLVALGAGLFGLLVPGMLPAGPPATPFVWTWVLMALGQLCMGMMMGTMFSLGTALQRSQREQSLLVLLPGLPQQGDLRARLLGRLAGLMLGMAAPGLLLLSLAVQVPVAGFLQGLGVGALLASLLLLRRWDTQSSAGSTGLLVAAMLVAMAWHELLPEAWGPLARGALAGTVLLGVALAWILALRRIRREPGPALPWGRNASRPHA